MASGCFMNTPLPWWIYWRGHFSLPKKPTQSACFSPLSPSFKNSLWTWTGPELTRNSWLFFFPPLLHPEQTNQTAALNASPSCCSSWAPAVQSTAFRALVFACCSYLLHGVPHKVVPLIIKVQLSLMPKSSNLPFGEKVCRKYIHLAQSSHSSAWCSPEMGGKMSEREPGVHSGCVCVCVCVSTDSGSRGRKWVRKQQLHRAAACCMTVRANFHMFRLIFPTFRCLNAHRLTSIFNIIPY